MRVEDLFGRRCKLLLKENREDSYPEFGVKCNGRKSVYFGRSARKVTERIDWRAITLRQPVETARVSEDLKC